MSDDADDDVPLPLAEAAARFFGPNSKFSAASLRCEARHGRLVIHRVAGKNCTTMRALREMMEKCRVEPEAPIKRTPIELDALEKAEECKKALAAARTIVAQVRDGTLSREQARRVGRRSKT
jgi:hypothetical protein